MTFQQRKQSDIQSVHFENLREKGVELDILREDTLHPLVSGNKFRKLKYNLQQALHEGHNQLLTFGGAHSNHILATAAAAKEQGLQSIGVIRGEELQDTSRWGPTLRQAASLGMTFHFVSRSAYRQKDDPGFIKELKSQFPPFYLIPEGGTNERAIQGCAEILDARTHHYTIVASAVGTGGTLAGLVKAKHPHQKVLGFSVLQGTFQKEVVARYASDTGYEITDAYSFGGYAKIDLTLIRFINDFYQQTGIPLDPVYTGKMVFGLVDRIQKGEFPENSRILAIHTGGLQGIPAMNEKLKKKNWPQILF